MYSSLILSLDRSRIKPPELLIQHSILQAGAAAGNIFPVNGCLAAGYKRLQRESEAQAGSGSAASTSSDPTTTTQRYQPTFLMFASEAKAVIKQLAAHGDLISNSNLNDRLDLLKLVRVTEGRLWPVPKYKTMELSLPELMDDSDFSPGFEEEVLMKEFTTRVEMCGSSSVGGGDGAVGEAEVSASADTVDGLETPVSMMSKKVKLRSVRDWFGSRKIKKNKVQMLRLKERDKLMFVHQTVYNTGPVRLHRKSKMDGSVSASCQKLLNLFMKGSWKEETSFTVPEKSTFAYGLMEIRGVQEEKLEISCEPWMNQSMFDRLINSDTSSDNSANSSVSLQQVKDGLEMKVAALQPLADVHNSTQCELLQTLRELLKNREALTQLEQMLDQSSAGAYEGPQSQAVSSFLNALNVSTTSTAQKDAVHLLVSALDTLPDDAPALLIASGPDVLRALNQLVDGLQVDGQNQLAEPLPPALKEDGELRWAAQLLCSSPQTLTELSEHWERPELPVGVLLEVLALVVRGLGLMQNLLSSGTDQSSQ
ncbi:uncharacterized protein LOC114867442 isoform X2 [Betta splendens]|uniref:Uncharacterized protein LOC114867442 isoform X2 n=1 Tax=Betta splendens TaxID=158456 RepID=A0A9W2Y6V7_BETSP|nr:uncharacterized protein LOC114867442 isoform X2 [Betta splendens]